ncbi:patatin-like phospholipase family protein [Flavobacterium sp. ZE23DGlu08]|uniref:patatin-like phospholipase family protein n=1 Tax=Flavobacterium sp. ZE23DGlu08 TaxID=3059026 RepID=UPI00265F52F7|nr:patatin-like phospholipase family protein [Flavobacterium sp. ZE23DGlu08]WKL43087.1 patatin-like phospholipase family protein [Flavobacterium sp. ZE23DGlu08]
MNKIGLALSGGGIKGIAHLGVLQYLTELDIKPSIISGTSAGSLVGVFYAAGYSPEEIFKIAKAEKFFNYSNLLVRNGGLFTPDVFEKITKKYITHDKLELLEIPTYVTATDLTNAKLHVFSTGSLSTAVKASCCVPLVFHPVFHEGVYLSDGGILNNFPTDIIENKCDKTIGINVSAINKIEGKMGYKRMIERTLHISLNNSIDSKMNKCNVYIEPPNMGDYGTFEFKKIDEIYQIGYNHAKFLKSELINLIEE